MARKTFRRDRLLRLARAGKLVAVSGRSYDEMTGTSNYTGSLPVRVIDSNTEWRDGFWNVREFYFTSSSGSASQNDEGTIDLHVHNNLSMTFRIVS